MLIYIIHRHMELSLPWERTDCTDLLLKNA